MVPDVEPPSGNISICPVSQHTQQTSYTVLTENDWNGVFGIWTDFTKYGGFPNDSISPAISGIYCGLSLKLI